jgi:hypothetical protein
MTQSTVKPDSVKIVKVDDIKAKVYLAKNISIQEPKANEQTKQDVPIYVYDEVIFLIDNRETLKESIEANFELYWEYGLNNKIPLI